MLSRPALSHFCYLSLSAFCTIPHLPSAILLLPRYPLPGDTRALSLNCRCLLFSLPLFTSLFLFVCASVNQLLISEPLNLLDLLSVSLSLFLSVSTHLVHSRMCSLCPSSSSSGINSQAAVEGGVVPDGPF